MNPSRSNPVSLKEAKELLKKTYNSMMNAFLELKNGREYHHTTTKKENLQVESACKENLQYSLHMLDDYSLNNFCSLFIY